jgi:uncharacterized OB-fold protein
VSTVPEADPPGRVIERASSGFWAAIDAGTLALSRCRRCGNSSLLEQACTGCGARDRDWQPASSRGHVTAVAIFHRPYHPYWHGRVPYAVVAVELEEGPLLIVNLEEREPGDIRVGDPVRIKVRQRDGQSIPAAVPADSQ